MSQPVSFDLERPVTFDRAHVFLRVALLIVIGWIAHPIGLLWLGLPVVAAILIFLGGGRRYLEAHGPTATRVLGWILAVVAYLALLTDRLPRRDQEAARFQVEPSGSPTVGSAIPSIIVLALLVLVGAIVWIVAAVLVLVDGSYPESLWRFLLGIVRWEACPLPYLASLVDHYPPFTLETGPLAPPAASS